MRSNAETHKFLEKKLESITNDNLRNSSLLLTNRTKIFIMKDEILNKLFNRNRAPREIIIKAF